MEANRLIRRARRASGLSLRALAEGAGTSHSTLAAYEQGRKVPRVDTLDRILRAAGYSPDVWLASRPDVGSERIAKGDELRQVLDLAGQFPARHSKKIEFPVFGRA